MEFEQSVWIDQLKKEVIFHNQYNASEENIRGRIVLDVGANVGVFSVFAASLGADKVYAFEPVPGTYDILCRHIKANGYDNVIVPIDAALGAAEGTSAAHFDAPGDPTATVAPMITARQQKEVEVTTVDAFVADNMVERVDFIKIDSEGSEAEILKGAKSTIERFHPVIAMSAYHKKEDIEELPKLLHSIVPEYKITLMERSEKDFYCKVD